MADFLMYLRSDAGETLQAQLRAQLVSAILDGQLVAGERLPSSRALARRLGVGRNTVTIACQRLLEEGYLDAQQRRGLYVTAEPANLRARANPQLSDHKDRIAWQRRFVARPSAMRNIDKPRDWRRYPYPFIYGQRDQALFPIRAWRDCTRQSLALSAVEAWSGDEVDTDDAMLVEQIRRRILPRRGVWARSDEVLITVGAQQALDLIARLLLGPAKAVGIENPCYVDARNIFALSGASIRPIPVDQHGLVVDRRLARCDLAYVTPSHQSPTTVTMPMERRLRLLEMARRHDVIVIEDDYESEANYLDNPMPALKSIDSTGRVLYVGSLSKLLAPGLRLGFLVGPAELIAEARALRRLAVRHPAANNQRAAALFLAGGHADALVRRLHEVYRRRWQAMGAALHRHLPESTVPPTFGGSSFWVAGPAGLDADDLATRAGQSGIIIEPGAVHFHGRRPPRRFFRLAFSAIPVERIEAGIRKLAELIHGS